MLQEPAVKRLRTFKEMLNILETEFVFKDHEDSKVILYFLYDDIIMRSWE